jgi:hypothetical protein
MKVLDLQCAHQHVFEGWFGSEEDFHQQLARGLVSCPLCGDQRVEKKLSAPRLNLRAAREESSATRPEGVTLSNHPAQAELVELQGRMLKAMREIMTSTEDVGERFAEQARAMHHGEIERRNIRGQTSAAVALELLEEGVEVMPLPMLPAVKDTLQ